MVDLSSSQTVQLPEGKPPFSYGFPMVFLWKLVIFQCLPQGIHRFSIPAIPTAPPFAAS
jgi:hypothetical protein